MKEEEAEQRKNQFLDEYNFFSPYCPWHSPNGICTATETECKAQTCAPMFWMGGLTANLYSKVMKAIGETPKYGVPNLEGMKLH